MQDDRKHGCNVPRLEPADSGHRDSRRAGVRLFIQGMGCVNCANRIHNALITMEGVGGVEIDHRTGQGTVLFNPDQVGPDGLLARVTRAGAASGHRYRAAVAPQPVQPTSRQPD